MTIRSASSSSATAPSEQLCPAVISTAMLPTRQFTILTRPLMNVTLRIAFWFGVSVRGGAPAPVPVPVPAPAPREVDAAGVFCDAAASASSRAAWHRALLTLRTHSLYISSSAVARAVCDWERRVKGMKDQRGGQEGGWVVHSWVSGVSESGQHGTGGQGHPDCSERSCVASGLQDSLPSLPVTTRAPLSAAPV